MTHGGYFRISNTVTLGMGIINGKLLFYYGISQESEEYTFSKLDYNNKTVYDYFNNPFTDYFGRTDLNLPPITIEDRTHPHKRAYHTPSILLVPISVSSENSVSTLTNLSEYAQLFILPTNDPKNIHAIMNDET